MSPRTVSLLLIGFIAVTWVVKFFKRKRRSSRGPFYASGGPEIHPVSKDFDWATTPPKKFRPFKPKFNLTMGITKPSHQDWLLLEDTYLERVNHHTDIFSSEQHRDDTGLCNVGAEASVAETYDFVVSFLTARYPQYFENQKTEKSSVVINKILGTSLPSSAQLAIQEGNTYRDLLRIIGEHTEEDFLLLSYDFEVEEYRLQACTGIAATRFLWKDRIGMKLTDLHGPIPQYKEKLQFSMNKYFRKMVPNDIVQRTTYKVQVSPRNLIFLPDTIPLNATRQEFIDNAYMRLERQQLFRLPTSNFILFTIRTYMYPLKEIRQEGLGGSLANSIRSWPDAFAKYKHREEWANQTLQYLESTI